MVGGERPLSRTFPSIPFPNPRAGSCGHWEVIHPCIATLSLQPAGQGVAELKSWEACRQVSDIVGSGKAKRAEHRFQLLLITLLVTNVSLSQNQEGHPALKLSSGSSHLSSSAAHGYCAIRRFVGAAATRIYLRSHIFNFESLFDSMSCIFSTKKVVKFVGHIFKGGNCVFLMLTDEHLSTEGGKMLRVEFEPREWRRGLFELLGKTARPPLSFVFQIDSIQILNEAKQEAIFKIQNTRYFRNIQI